MDLLAQQVFCPQKPHAPSSKPTSGGNPGTGRISGIFTEVPTPSAFRFQVSKVIDLFYNRRCRTGGLDPWRSVVHVKYRLVEYPQINWSEISVGNEAVRRLGIYSSRRASARAAPPSRSGSRGEMP